MMGKESKIPNISPVSRKVGLCLVVVRACKAEFKAHRRTYARRARSSRFPWPAGACAIGALLPWIVARSFAWRWQVAGAAAMLAMLVVRTNAARFRHTAGAMFIKRGLSAGFSATGPA